jgi:hypothetical protein
VCVWLCASVPLEPGVEAACFISLLFVV